APDLLTLIDTRHLEQHMRSYPPLEGWIEVDCKVCRKDHDAVERLELFQQNIDDRIRLAEKAVVERRGTSRGNGVRFVEQQHRVLLPRHSEYPRDRLRRLAHLDCFHLRVANN